MLNYYLKLEGITGGSVDPRHLGWIEVLSFSGGISSASPAPDDPSSGVDLHDFSFVKFIDISSPKLLEACGNQTSFEDVIFEICSESSEPVVTYILSGGRISSIAPGGSSEGADFPMESFSVSMESVEWRYTKYSGPESSPVTASARFALRVSRPVLKYQSAKRDLVQLCPKLHSS